MNDEDIELSLMARILETFAETAYDVDVLRIVGGFKQEAESANTITADEAEYLRDLIQQLWEQFKGDGNKNHLYEEHLYNARIYRS